jgi:putative copper resistance protein D
VRAVHPARVASFVTGIALLLFTVSSAIDIYAMAVFWDHMVEHLLLIMVVPALLVLGHPITVARAAASTRGKEGAVDAFVRSWPVSLLTHPGVGLGIYSVVIIGTHLTGFMDAMAMHGWLMGAEQWLYVVSGYLFLLPLLGSEPIRWQVPHLGKLALILVGMTPDTVVGIVLMQTTYNMFPMMEAGHPSWAPAPVDDLTIAGGLMWAGGDGLMMLFGVGVTLAMISHPGSASVLGQRLESVRRRTLAEHVALAGGTTALAEEGDVDDDDAMLDAYNEMLARMSGQQPKQSG